jgi:hypothetical protein
MLRPLWPSLSLRKPTSNTEKPPQRGKSALRLAATLDVRPANWTKYVGVHRLNVSRSIVIPNASTQTIQKAKLVSNGRKIDPTFARFPSPARS